MEQQLYQPLSAALHVQPTHSPQPHYSAYAPHAPPPAAPNGAHHNQREEEEEEEDEEEAVEEELDHARARRSPNMQSSSHAAVGHPSKPVGNPPPANALQYPSQSHAQMQRDDDVTQDPTAADDTKRKPGRPRGSRNRKPRASTSSASKSNVQHPGFYSYPPVPGGTAQNTQFNEFQWRALNLCSEFYNAAEELIKAAPPMVIAQCYHSGPAPKIDPLVVIGDAKRVCDSLLNNISAQAGQPPPTAPTYQSVPTYSTMPPPAAPTAPPPTAASATPPNVMNNSQSYMLPTMAPPPGYPQPYYPAPYPPAPGSRYPTTPYYYAQPNSYYSTQAPAPAVVSAPNAAHPPSAPSVPTAAVPAPPPAPQPQPPAPAPTPATPPAPATTAVAGPPPPSPASGISAFNAATGTVAAGGTQGAWSDEETERLKRLAEQSRETGPNKGEIEWDWVIQQWGNTRTRHQILLKATALGLKESTTRGTKRRRETDASAADSRQPPPPPSSTPSTNYVQPPPAAVNVHAPSPAQSSANSNPPSAQASPATQPLRPPSSSVSSNVTPTRANPATGNAYPWPMPTVASASPLLSHPQTDTSRPAYYRPGQPAYPPPPTATSAAQQATNARPPSSHGTTAPPHHYLYRSNGSTAPTR